MCVCVCVCVLWRSLVEECTNQFRVADFYRCGLTLTHSLHSISPCLLPLSFLPSFPPSFLVPPLHPPLSLPLTFSLPPSLPHSLPPSCLVPPSTLPSLFLLPSPSLLPSLSPSPCCPSRLKDLTAYNMERTITILGTIDNCKKAESLISAKLRASYESDMAQFIPVSVSIY